MNKRLWAVGNYARFVRPGWERIGATAGDTSVTAFRQAATGKFAIVAINAGTKSKDVELNLNGLAVSSVTPYTTSSTQDLATGPAIATTNGRLTVSLAPSTISTFTGKAKTTSPLAVSITESRAYTGDGVGDCDGHQRWEVHRERLRHNCRAPRCHTEPVDGQVRSPVAGSERDHPGLAGSSPECNDRYPHR